MNETCIRIEDGLEKAIRLDAKINNPHINSLFDVFPNILYIETGISFANTSKKTYSKILQVFSNIAKEHNLNYERDIENHL